MTTARSLRRGKFFRVQAPEQGGVDGRCPEESTGNKEMQTRYFVFSGGKNEVPRKRNQMGGEGVRRT